MPFPFAEAQAGYRPRPAHNALKDLVEENLEDLFRLWEERFEKDYGPLRQRQRQLFESFLRCGDLPS